MTTLDKVKNKIGEINPFAVIRRKKMRRNLRNKEFTLLTPDCIGGRLYHDLRLQFRSPTINLMMFQPHFLLFVSNIEEYVDGSFTFYSDAEYTCPCAKLKPKKEDLPEIIVHFSHYDDKDIAEKKWRERAKRINWDNIFVLIEERDGITEEELKRLANLNVKGVVAFTYNKYTEMPYSVYLPKYHNDGEVGNILARRYWDDSREYERIFDFVKWFNEANGKDYNVSSFNRISGDK